jgi:hypothetical protein
VILALLVLVVAAWFGVVLIRRPLADLCPVERAAAGAVVGLALFTWLLYWAAAAFGLGPGTILATVAAFGAGALLLGPPGRPAAHPEPASADRRPGRTGWLVFVIAGGWWIARIFRRAAYWRPEGMFTGSIHNYGDITSHLGMVLAFAHGQNFPPESHIFAGTRLSYPFLANLLPAALVRGGMEVTQAMALEGVILAVAFAICLAALGTDLTGSRRAGTLGALLFLLNGGWGFAYFFWHWIGLGGFRLDPSRDYTYLPEARIFWLNPLIGVHLSQRPFLFGFPLAALIFLCWWRGVRAQGQSARAAFVLAGLLSGMLSLFHTTTFLVVACLGLLLGLIFWRPRDWVAWGLVMTAVAAPAIVWLAPSGDRLGLGAVAAALGWPPQVQSVGRFFYRHFGWEKGPDNVAWFWFKNLGLFPVAFGMALAARRIDPVLRRFTAPFALCFLVPNVMSLTMWLWDNTKYMVYWPLVGGPLVALFLIRAAEGGRRWRRGVAVGVGASLILSGALDVFRYGAGLNGEYHEFTRDDARVAELLRAETAPRAVILAAPTHNSPVFLAGRKLVLGYPGHLWPLGIEYGERERDVRSMLAGDGRAADLVRAYGVTHALIGDLERRHFGANQAFFEGRYPKIAQVGPYAVYRTGQAARSSHGPGGEIAAASELRFRPGTAGP